VRERLLLFRVGSGTDWQRAGVTGETVTALVAKGLLVRDGAGRLTLNVTKLDVPGVRRHELGIATAGPKTIPAVGTTRRCTTARVSTV